MIVPTLTITDPSGSATDYSRLFMRSHSEHTTTDSKDENKYDITLANGGGSLFGKFKPKSVIELKVINVRTRCPEDGDTTEEEIPILKGEVQHVTCDEVECKIEGSCPQGGMVSAQPKPFTWPEEHSISRIVADLVFAFKGLSSSHINIEIDKDRDTPAQHNPKSGELLDFNTAIQQFADQAGCVWFFDEHGDFWFMPPDHLFGVRDLTGHVVRGQTASTMVGLCTIVTVYGATNAEKPSDDRATNLSHKKQYARLRADDPEIVALMNGEDMIANYGELYAPDIVVPNCNEARAKEIAKNVLLWFLQFKDVPQVKVEGVAPGVFTRVGYQPFNANPPPISCSSGARAATVGMITGTVTKRVVDISPEEGLVCTLDVATNFKGTTDGRDIANDAFVNQYNGAWPVNA